MKSHHLEAGARRSRSALAALALFAALVACVAGAKPGDAAGAEPGSPTGASPLLLLQGPGWHVQNAEEHLSREGIDASLEFVTGKPIPYETVKVSGPNKHPRESGMFPAAVRQRRVELSWRPASLKQTEEWIQGQPHPRGRQVLQLPVLGTTAYVDTRDHFYSNQ